VNRLLAVVVDVVVVDASDGLPKLKLEAGFVSVEGAPNEGKEPWNMKTASHTWIFNSIEP
jgi:hypothetical protein